MQKINLTQTTNSFPYETLMESLAVAITTGKIIVGYSASLVYALKNKAQLIVVSNDFPSNKKQIIQGTGVPIFEINVEFTEILNFSHVVDCVTLIDVGESNILMLIK